jgi:hypothetical protein
MCWPSEGCQSVPMSQRIPARYLPILLVSLTLEISMLLPILSMLPMIFLHWHSPLSLFSSPE